MIEVPPIMPFFYASIKKRTDYALILPYCARKIHTALWQLEDPGLET